MALMFRNKPKLAIGAGLLLVFTLFVGIDMEPVLSDHELTTVPVPFIKRQPALALVFSLPVEPFRVMHHDTDMPDVKRLALQRYCAVRFGESEADCLATLEGRLRESGFYKAE
ncbi:hypothetical protein LLG90_19865 [Aromatoleum toluclasticum]|uniref:hypothetical protein n=1 Tax=Aromatoleum toluclasticum TaxID=92003 RepID=UPI001D1896D2|nr:hypothetical protein [Aromatoleum toluclasticum]MCC4117620.1 hypothetical protein [Aromatoleum toluclasticum]